MRGEPFRGSEAVAAGRVTRGLLRSSRFTRVFPDVYVPAGVEIDHRVRSLAALVLVGERGVLAGDSAATVLGAPCAPWSTPAEVLGRIARSLELPVAAAVPDLLPSFDPARLPRMPWVVDGLA